MIRKAFLVPFAVGCTLLVQGCKKEAAVDSVVSAETVSEEGAAAKPSAPQGKLTTVTVVSNTPGSLELALPVNSNNERIKFEELKNVTGSWEQTYGGDRIIAHEAGAGFTVDIINDKPEMPFLQHVDGPDVTITYDGNVKKISLKGEAYGWRPEILY